MVPQVLHGRRDRTTIQPRPEAAHILVQAARSRILPVSWDSASMFPGNQLAPRLREAFQVCSWVLSTYRTTSRIAMRLGSATRRLSIRSNARA
jgi:hypothetical protein